MNALGKLGVCALLICAGGCGVDASTNESVSHSEQRLVDITSVLGFEHPLTEWTATNLKPLQGNQHTAGQFSEEFTVTSSGGTLQSVALTSLGKTASVVTAQVWLPQYLAGQSTQGHVVLRLNSATAGLNDVHVQSPAFQNAPTHTFLPVSFALPASVVNSLSNKTYSDLRVSLEFDFAPNPQSSVGFADPFYVDALDFGLAGSSTGSSPDLGLSSTKLDLAVSANACAVNVAQDYFRVKNSDPAAVALSDISIKYWINDTTGNGVAPQITYGGCVTNPSGTCVHQVSNVTATAVAFPACGPDAAHQANWEITISTTDSSALSPGFTWTGVQSSVNLADYSAFSPGSSTWYSTCGALQPFQSDAHFAVYAKHQLVTSNGITAPACRAPHGTQQLTGYRKPKFASAPLVGPVPPTTQLTMEISLPVRVPTDFPSLPDFARQVSDPTDTHYRQFLTEADFAAHYRPNQSDYDALIAFVQANGLTVLNSYPDNELLDVTGPAAAFNRLLFANLNYYKRPDGSQFYALDREPSLALSTKVLVVGGADTFHRPTRAAMPSGPNGDLIGNDYRSAYVSGCLGLDGSGQSIAIYEEQGFRVSDVKAYDAAAGIADPSIGTDTFTANFPASLFVPDLKTTDSSEASVDIEVAHAMAPGAQLIVYQSPEATGPGVNFADDMLHAMAHPPSALPRSYQVTSSWFIEGDDDARQSVNEMAAFGQSFFQASGDGGGFTANPLDTRTFENTTVVGGTLLPAFGAGTAPVEVAWPGSGGGYFAATAIPSYQLPFAGSNTASSTLRNFPDVSMVAGGAACFFTTSGGAQADFPQIGTSISTPLFAAYMALANQKSAASGVAAVGFANPVLYAIAKGSLYSTCFNDVLTGSNPQLTSGGGAFVDAPDLPTPATGFPAGTGYDLVTGLGSPTCTLITQLASPTPTVPVPPPTTPPTGPTTPPTGPTPPAPAALPFAGLGDGNSCGIVQGALECWGDNSESQNATGDTSPHASPVCNQFSTAGTAVISAAVGDWHGCSVLANGTVWCWGGNRAGQVGPQGVGKTIVSVPVQVTGLPTTAKQVVAGGETTCALLSDGTAWCWGLNNQGQFGNGTKGGFNDVNPNPTQVNLPPATQLSMEVEGGSYLCALLQSGNVECWGGNTHLGTGSVGTSTTPKMVATFNVPLANVIQISAGGGHTCALTQPATGSPAHVLYCWGDNGDNQLGEGTINTGAIPTTEVSPVRAIELSGCGPSGNPAGTGCLTPFDVIAVACGGDFTCAVISDGTVRCLGSNTLGQLGNGFTSVVPEDHAQLVTGLAGAVAVVASATGVCAQGSGGGLSCWGGSPLGNGTNGSSSTAVSTDFKRCF